MSNTCLKGLLISIVSTLLLTIGIILAVSLMLSSTTIDAKDFDKNYVGVVFSPYVKNKEGSATPPWNSYSQEEVGTMLKLISTKFRSISTYGMGASSDRSTWETGDAVGFVGVAAARLNKQSSSSVISASVAIWQHDVQSILINELKTAFDVTDEANKIHKETIWGITMTSNYIESPQQSDRVDRVSGLLSMGKNISISKNIPVKLGIRLSICNKLTNDLKVILQKIDYLICFVNPTKAQGEFSIKSTVSHLVDAMTEMKKSVKNMNSKVEVIFETGWPSQGISGANLPTSTKNMKEFWIEISKWASSDKTRVYFLEAIDEPWKIFSDDDKSPIGPCGSEGHFGWWRRLKNSDSSIHSYEEKISSETNHTSTSCRV